jgi:hypothetical protein
VAHGRRRIGADMDRLGAYDTQDAGCISQEEEGGGRRIRENEINFGKLI